MKSVACDGTPGVAWMGVMPKGGDEDDWAEKLSQLQAPTPYWGVDDVLAAQRTIALCFKEMGGTRSTNGLYCFNHFYMAVTRGVREQIAEMRSKDSYPVAPKRSDDAFDCDWEWAADFMRRLDVNFYIRYRDALCTPGDRKRIPAAWRPLLTTATERRRLPIEWALDGINAHILCDLPYAIAQTLIHMGYSHFPEADTPEHMAFQRLNDVIYEVAVRGLNRDFMPGFPGLAFFVLPVPIEWLTKTYITSIRELAWTRAKPLWRFLKAEPDDSGSTVEIRRDIEAIFEKDAERFNKELEHLFRDVSGGWLGTLGRWWSRWRGLPIAKTA